MKGRVLICTGTGKGKTTAALGLALRAVGHGLRVLVVQFMKARTDTGEHLAAARLAPELEVRVRGTGFVNRDDPASVARARAKAAQALGEAAGTLHGRYDVVILDEALTALQYGLIEPASLLDALAARSESVHVVLTGGESAPREIIDLADTVTEMRNVKHAFELGVDAQEGIEF